MLELNNKKLELKFNDKLYVLRYPYVSELGKFSDLKDKDNVQVITELLVDLGLPRKVCEVLEVDHMNALVKELTTVKK